MRIPHYVYAIAFGALIAVVVITMTINAFSFSPAARTAPLLVGIPTSLVAIAMVGRDIARVKRGDASVGQSSEQERDRYADADEESSDAGSEPGTGSVKALERASAPQATGWVIGLVVLIWLFGLIIASFLFVLSFLKIFARERWLISILYALGTTAVIYFLFGELLDQTLYEGRYGGFLPF